MPMVHQGAVVVVTKGPLVKAIAFLLWLVALPLAAEVLPPDRLDIMYHRYDGGGATISGPSILIRKGIGSTVSFSGNYYADMVSSASIDVLATASAYTEERTEFSIGTDYLHDRTIIRLGYSNSEENDYSSETVNFSISQNFFGDLTTLTMGVSYGEDVVGQTGNAEFQRDVDRRRYQLDISQIVTKSLIAAVSVETAIDNGYLNNPYRSVRYLDDDAALGYSYQQEVYPEARNSDAVGFRAIYYLPYRAALRADYRLYQDSWGIEADNWALRYTHPWGDSWLFEIKYRNYKQTGADFYSDLFAYRDAQNFLARDKELSRFNSNTLGLGITYTLPGGMIPGIDRSTINLYWDRLNFNYEDFRNVLVTDVAVGEEPLYNFSANVIRLYFSFWF